MTWLGQEATRMPSQAGGPEKKAMIRGTSINGETDTTHMLSTAFLASCVASLGGSSIATTKRRTRCSRSVGPGLVPTSESQDTITVALHYLFF
jgi:hypothetical protein